METWARFVWNGDSLLPGPFPLDDVRLSSRPLHIEFRRNGRGGLPLDALRILIPSWDKVQFDPDGFSHREVMDLLLLGAERVCIDIWASDKEIELGHAVTERVLLRERLPTELNALYLTDELFPRLKELSHLGPGGILLVGRKKGDVGFVHDRLPRDILASFDWWLAPDEGNEVPLKNRGSVTGWVLDGSRLVGGSQ
jgi:hypothetical protein